MKTLSLLFIGMLLGIALTVTLPVLAQTFSGDGRTFSNPDLVQRYGGIYNRGIGFSGHNDSERSIGSYQVPSQDQPC